MTPGSITALVETLVSVGATPQQILAAVRTAEQSKDEAIEQSRAKARARVQKWRNSNGVTSRNVTERSVAATKRLTRAEDITSNLEITGKEKKERTRASRLPKDWVLPTEWRDEAIKAGLSPERSDSEARKMHNWSLADRNGAKLDWHATWRNWFQRVVEAKPPDKPPKPRNAGELARLQLKAMNDAPDTEARLIDTSHGSPGFAGSGLARRFTVASGR